MEQFKTNSYFFSCKRYFIEQIKKNYVNLTSFLSQILYVCMHVCMYIYIYVCVFVYVCVYMITYVHICVEARGKHQASFSTSLPHNFVIGVLLDLDLTISSSQ